jgi:hypothetical protein
VHAGEADPGNTEWVMAHSEVIPTFEEDCAGKKELFLGLFRSYDLLEPVI